MVAKTRALSLTIFIFICRRFLQAAQRKQVPIAMANRGQGMRYTYPGPFSDRGAVLYLNRYSRSASLPLGIVAIFSFPGN